MEAAPQPDAAPVRVLIADDEPLFVECVRKPCSRSTSGLRSSALRGTARGRRPLDDARPGCDADGHQDADPRRHRGDAADPRAPSNACILMLTGSNIAAEIDRSRQAAPRRI